MTAIAANHTSSTKHSSSSSLGRGRLHRRTISIAITCLGIIAVVATQYYEAAKHSNMRNPILSKEEYMSDSVVDFRRDNHRGARTTPDDKAERPVNAAAKSDKVVKSKPSNNNNNNDEDPGLTHNGTPLHVVFSTSCSDQMHWESFVFFYHAWKVKQPGTVTRIASGCNDEEAAAAVAFHQASIQSKISDRFYLHLTPDFSKQRLHDNAKSSYKYMNKPFGLRDWLENSLGMEEEDTKSTNNNNDDPKGRPSLAAKAGVEDGVVILMDPDMVLLRPLLHDFSQEDVIWAEEKPTTTIVTHGKPIAQQDGYLDNKWMNINGTFVTGDATIGRPKDRTGPLNWNTGPPYLATVKDMYDISLLWTVYAPRVDHVNPGLFAEMQGFIWATYKLNLPHALIKSIVVSNPETPHREGWAYVDALPDDEVCAPPSASTKLPIGLHYCKRYALGPDFFFSKYRLKKNYLACEKNLLMPPPTDIAIKYDYFIAPPPASGKPPQEVEKKTFTQKRAKREAYMMCGLISAVNEAAIYYKQQNCGVNANYNKVYTIKNDPSKY